MSLPIRTTIIDIQEVCDYLATKPTGATIKEAKAVLDPKRMDGRKLNALRFWGFIEDEGNRLKISEKGREFIKDEKGRVKVITEIIKNIGPYQAIVERAVHRHEDSLTTTIVAAHWHDHFKDQVSRNDKVLKDQAVCFFQLASAALLGALIVGRKGQPTRFSFNIEVLNSLVGKSSTPEETKKEEKPETPVEEEIPLESPQEEEKPITLRQGIFIAHGKNKKPLEQLKKILNEFKIPYKIAIEEPNLGRPISSKVREVMKSCNCAILIFTADEELKDKVGNIIWRPSENVVYELGASGYLYDNRIVIMKEDKVNFPTNFQDIGYISFEKDQLKAKAMEILKELIGFGIVKVST